MNIKKSFLTCLLLCSFILMFSPFIYAGSSILEIQNKAINVYEKLDIKVLQNDKTKVYNYSSSNTYVASVDSNGIITGNHFGEAIITVSDLDGNSSKLNLSVGFYKGIDISTFNGNVDFSSIKRQGIDFVMIRASYGWYDDQNKADGKAYEFQYDTQLLNNLKGASQNGIPFGIYHYSYATNEEEASLEAEYVLNALQEYGKSYASNITLPIAYDVEDPSISGISAEQITKNIITFCTKIRNAGYTPMVYANKTWFLQHMNISTLSSLGYEFWYAFWPDASINFSNKIEIGNTGIVPMIWQYSSYGNIEGANTKEGRVDLNIMYMKEQVKLTFISDSQVILEKGIDKGSSTALPEAKKDGYTFVKWVTENLQNVDENTVFNVNTTLNAVYRLNSIKISSTSKSLMTGQTLDLSVTDIYGKNIEDEHCVIFDSSDENILTVDDTGKVTAKNLGQAVVKAYINNDKNIFDSITINVTDKYFDGDINKDGCININDINYGLRGLTKGTLTDEEKQIGDLNKDGTFNINDINQMLRKFVGKI